MAIWIDIMGRLTFKFSSIEEDGKYHSNLAVSAQIIYFLEMLKFSIFIFVKKIFLVKENEEKFENLRECMYMK
jgi:hypothetical protein